MAPKPYLPGAPQGRPPAEPQPAGPCGAKMVGLGGLEPPTSRLSSARSNQLSYKPVSEDRGRSAKNGCSRFPTPRRPISWRKERRRRRNPAKRGLTGRLFSERTTNRSRAKPENPLMRSISRKEVIQPQVPLRLPCYDFTPVADPTVAGCLLERLARRLRVKPTPMV